MTTLAIDAAIQEYGQRFRHGDRLAITDFENRYGRMLRIIIARILRSNRARSTFELSVQMHLKRLSSTHSRIEADQAVVRRVCEAMLASHAPIGSRV